MNLPLKLKKLLTRDKLIILGTSSKNGKPNIIIVASYGIFDNRILISDCQMNKTLKNLNENKSIALCVFNKKDPFQIKGEASYFQKGKFFEIVKKFCEGNSYKPKGAILIKINEIYDLDKCSRLK